MQWLESGAYLSEQMEQVSSIGHQMSIAGGGLGADGVPV